MQINVYPKNAAMAFSKRAMLSLLIIVLIFPLSSVAISNVTEDEREITQKRIKASHFLHQATFGPKYFQITQLADRMAEIGDIAALEEWITEQFERSFSGQNSFEIVARGMVANAGFEVDDKFESTPGLDFPIQEFRDYAWWDRVLTGNDQLRQRTAWALIQILVTSDRAPRLNNPDRGNWLGILNYYDMLMRNAFGNYRELLYDVSLHPVMGSYLSHVKNSKGDPERGTFPDENYAREILQLFSIGVFSLKRNGEVNLDASGQAIENYDNETIQNFAKIFTGLEFAPSEGRDGFDRNPPQLFEPMAMYEDFHDRGEKTLLNNQVVAADQDGLEDINAALDNIFDHPSIAPFISKALIKRFVKSNPSPRYVASVSDAFIDDGSGNRGNMQAVIRAILMDEEARDSITM